MSTARGNIWVTVYIDDLSIDDSDCNSDAKFSDQRSVVAADSRLLVCFKKWMKQTEN